jgi:pimeloyl-ACP methyl ester carboxylesterase
MTAVMTQQTHAPALVWTLLEGRSIFEFGSFLSLRLLMRHLHKGDGHPVIVFPGFLASGRSTRPMRGLLKDLGYIVYDWGLGRNLHFNPQREADMHALLERVYREHGRKVSLIGWSLGGVFAREISKFHPEYVRQVISLGSPITGPRHSARAAPIFEALNGKPTPATRKRLLKLHEVPPVPATSIYTKSDGVVHWEGSIQDESPEAENIQVPASHLGLGVNPLVMYILANRLAQAEGDWAPFDIKGVRRLIYKAPK